jgi:tetratricopeptide (TPR) repeat protein
MKSLVITLAIFCVATIGATFIYMDWKKPQPVVAPPGAESAPEPAAPMKVRRVNTPEPTPDQTASAEINPATSAPVAALVATAAAPDDSATPLKKALSVLISSQSSFDDKQAALKQLREANQLDQAIEALKQGATNNPTSVEYPTALGELYLQQAGIAARAGKSMNEMAMFGIQADQNFDNALKLDPANWDAQFFKAAALAHWPAELNKGDEVIQRFSALIDQQETMTPQPQFVKTYILLGDQYQKMGKPDYANATWQLGATKFPSDPVLQKKLHGQ